MEGLPSPPAGGGPESTARAGGLGQSEFTRMMSAVPVSAPAPAPAPGGRGQAAPTPAPAGEEGEEGKPSLTKLFIALGVVLLLAVVLIVFFAIKK